MHGRSINLTYNNALSSGNFYLHSPLPANHASQGRVTAKSSLKPFQRRYSRPPPQHDFSSPPLPALSAVQGSCRRGWAVPGWARREQGLRSAPPAAGEEPGTAAPRPPSPPTNTRLCSEHRPNSDSTEPSLPINNQHTGVYTHCKQCKSHKHRKREASRRQEDAKDDAKCKTKKVFPPLGNVAIYLADFLFATHGI